MTEIGEKLLKIKASLPQSVTLIAVSKYHPNEDVMDAYNEGQRIFGENIVQELREKYDSLPKDIEWHFIGHLQKNKVKYIAPFVSMIHSVDTYSLLETINKYAEKNGRIIPCLLQLHVAKEETKFGFTPEECQEMLQKGDWKELKNVEICGIMGMATNTDDEKQVHEEFRTLKETFKSIKTTYFADQANFQCCSWGMSSDYEIAIEEGSNMVRIGSSIFGSRPPKAQVK